MRKPLIALLIALVVVPVGAAYAFLGAGIGGTGSGSGSGTGGGTGIGTATAAASGTKYSSWMGTIELVVTRQQGVDLGTYSYTQLFIPIPQNVSMATIRADVSKTLLPNGQDTISVGLWVADSSGRILACLYTKVREVEFAQKNTIFVEPWQSQNIPSIDCSSTRLYPQVKDQIKNGGYVAVTFTPADFEPGLRLLGKSAGELTVVGIFPLYKTHLYTVDCTVISVKTTGLYSWFKPMITWAVVDGVRYEGQGGVVNVDGPVSGAVTVNLWGALIFIPLNMTVTFNV